MQTRAALQQFINNYDSEIRRIFAENDINFANARLYIVANKIILFVEKNRAELESALNDFCNQQGIRLPVTVSRSSLTDHARRTGMNAEQALPLNQFFTANAVQAVGSHNAAKLFAPGVKPTVTAPITPPLALTLETQSVAQESSAKKLNRRERRQRLQSAPNLSHMQIKQQLTEIRAMRGNNYREIMPYLEALPPVLAQVVVNYLYDQAIIFYNKAADGALEAMVGCIEILPDEPTAKKQALIKVTALYASRDIQLELKDPRIDPAVFQMQAKQYLTNAFAGIYKSAVNHLYPDGGAVSSTDTNSFEFDLQRETKLSDGSLLSHKFIDAITANAFGNIDSATVKEVKDELKEVYSALHKDEQKTAPVVVNEAELLKDLASKQFSITLTENHFTIRYAKPHNDFPAGSVASLTQYFKTCAEKRVPIEKIVIDFNVRTKQQFLDLLNVGHEFSSKPMEFKVLNLQNAPALVNAIEAYYKQNNRLPFHFCQDITLSSLVGALSSTNPECLNKWYKLAGVTEKAADLNFMRPLRSVNDSQPQQDNKVVRRRFNP